MERISQSDQRPERTSKQTGKAALGPWHYSQYKYQELTDNQRELHGDPREKSHGQLPDSNFTPSDEESDHQSLHHPASGFGGSSDFYARDPSASDQGSLAGDLRYLLDDKPSSNVSMRVFSWWKDPQTFQMKHTYITRRKDTVKNFTNFG